MAGRKGEAVERPEERLERDKEAFSHDVSLPDAPAPGVS
jgi:hypothetical protein